MNNVNQIVLAYLAIWCWVDGFTTTAFGLTVLVLTEALWEPFAKVSPSRNTQKTVS